MLISLRRLMSFTLQSLIDRSLALSLFLFLCGTLAHAQGNVVLVQHASKDAGTTTSSSLAFTSINTAGNWIGVCIRAGKSGQAFTVTDSKGNTYHKAVQFNVTVDAPNGDTLGIFYAENIGGGANTLTVSDTISGTLRFAILEYSGVAMANSLDTTAAAQGTSASPNSGNAATTTNGDLLLGTVLTGNPASFTAGNGYKIEETVPAEPNTKLIAEDRVEAVAGSISASASLGASDNWGAALAAFKAASGTGGTASGITATAGTPQSTAIHTAFATQLQATVKDSLNNPVSGVAVTFTAPASGASGTFPGSVTSVTVNTDASGVATAPVLTANSTAGNYTVTAKAGAIGPANFNLTNNAGPAANLAATAGTPQSATIGTAFGTALQAKATDSGGNPVSGVAVTFAAPASGASGTFPGSVTSVTVNTDASGVATAPIFTANSIASGPYNVTASVAGVTTQASFSLTNLPTATGGVALVQHTSKDAGTTTSSSLAFSLNNATGNWIAVVIRAGKQGQVFTVTDLRGNTYKKAIQFNETVDGTTLGVSYAENIFGGPNTITVSDTISGTLRFAILEYSGVAIANSLDGAATATQGTSASPNSGNLTTTSNGDLLLGEIWTANPANFTAGSGYLIEETVPAEPSTKLIVEDQVQSIAGSTSASASLGASDNWGAGLAAFKSANSGPPPPISISVLPVSASVVKGLTQDFTATVKFDAQNAGVSWSLSGAGCSGNTCGTLSNVTSTSVTYTAPPSVPNPATVTLTATSVTDHTKSASASITVLVSAPIVVTVSPKRTALTMSQTQQLTAAVANDPQNLGVTWAVDGSNGGNTTTGTVTSSGLFTPGAQAGSHTVTATSNSDASVSASATVAVTDLAGVFTYHNDVARTGQNLKEYALTTATVNSSTFGRLFSCPVDGYVYAEPLYVANLLVGATKRNVVYIATEHDSVYAFDADSPSCVPLWNTSGSGKVSFLSSGVTTMSWQDTGNATNDVFPEIGITSTPIIDPATNTIYVEAKTKETVGSGCSSGNPCYVHRLHALDITSGSEKFGGPIVISATNFDSHQHFNRPALLLNNSTIYVAFGSHGDGCPWQGWLFGYNSATLAQTFVWSTSDPTSGCNGAAIWQGGAGPAVDASGNVYVITGNGTYDGTTNFSESVMKFSPAGALLDWFTPFNRSTLDANDIDMGSSGAIILPDAVGSTAHAHLLLATGKIAILYLLDQANMGKFHSGSNLDVQEVIPVPPPNTTQFDGGDYGVPAYWNGNIYTTGQNYPLSQFTISNGTITTPQSAKSNNTFPPRGAVPAVSASGTTNGIVWVLDLSGWTGTGSAVLYAYDAANVSNLLYSSPSSGSGAAGAAVKFTVPTVANGKVYVGGQSSFTVFGLLPN